MDGRMGEPMGRQLHTGPCSETRPRPWTLMKQGHVRKTEPGKIYHSLQCKFVTQTDS